MAAHAGQYDDFAVISSTLGVQDGRVCVGEASRGDIGCPTYAPYVASDGSISATRFVGDGSGLFNIAGASADRIVSGTTSMLAISNTGYISVTQSGVNTAYFHPSMGLVTVGVSSTGGISGTTGYFSGAVGVGTNQPSATLHIMGGSGGSDVIRLSRPDSTNVYGIGIANNAFNIYNESPYGSSRSLKMMLNNTGLLLGDLPNNQSSVPSSTLHVSGTALTTSWTGINFSNAGNVVPSAPLEVSGTVSATTGYFSGNVTTGGSYNLASTGWLAWASSTYNSIYGNATSKYIAINVSGTEAVRVVSSGYVGIGTATPKVSLDIGNNSFRLGGEGQYISFNGYYDSSAAGWKSVAANSYMGAIRMGMQYAGEGGDLQFMTQAGLTANSTPDASVTTARRMIIRRAGDIRIANGLHVGDVSLASTPTTALEVSGTVSATVLQVANTAPDSACASTSDLGKMRRNPTTGRMQVCR
ncbi:MAG: hypothetical protein AB7E55_14675 [Pigmentiphaga sp.]